MNSFYCSNFMKNSVGKLDETLRGNFFLPHINSSYCTSFNNFLLNLPFSFETQNTEIKIIV